MIVDSQDFINRLKDMGGNPSAMLSLAGIFLSDPNVNIAVNEEIAVFPDDKAGIKDYKLFFRIDLDTDNLCITMVKDIEDTSEDDIQGSKTLIYSDFYKTINILSH